MATIFLPTSINLDIGGDLQVRGAKPPIARSDLVQQDNQEYVIPLTNLRVWDAFATVLPATAAADDLGLVGGTFATATPTVETTNQASGGSATLYARFTIGLPPEYVAGQTVTLRVRGGMSGAVADAEATVDFAVYKTDEEGLVSGSDLAPAATTDNINSLTFADVDFALTSTGLNPGDELDVRMSVLVNDAATGGTVKGVIGKLSMLCDIKG